MFSPIHKLSKCFINKIDIVTLNRTVAVLVPLLSLFSLLWIFHIYWHICHSTKNALTSLILLKRDTAHGCNYCHKWRWCTFSTHPKYPIPNPKCWSHQVCHPNIDLRRFVSGQREYWFTPLCLGTTRIYALFWRNIYKPKYTVVFKKHRKNCECCPVSQLIVRLNKDCLMMTHATLCYYTVLYSGVLEWQRSALVDFSPLCNVVLRVHYDASTMQCNAMRWLARQWALVDFSPLCNVV